MTEADVNREQFSQETVGEFPPQDGARRDSRTALVSIRSWWRQHRISTMLRNVGAILVAVWIVARVLSVNIFPVLTNDSVGYLSHALNPFADGLVWSGYRQVGYQVFLWATHHMGGLVGIEPLLAVATVQRMLLVAGMIYSVWLFRWWAVPLLLVLSSPDILAYMNLLLTEGILVPLSVLAALAMAHWVLLDLGIGAAGILTNCRARTGEANSRRLRRVLLGAAAVSVLALSMTKIQFAIVVLPLGVMILKQYRAGDRRFAMGIGALVISLLSMTLLTMTIENRVEYDDAFPISRGARNSYWGTYQLVFNLHPENRQDPALAEYFNDGQPFDAIREIESSFDTYPAQREQFENLVENMLRDAGLRRRPEQLRSFLAGLRGGRYDDIAGIVRRIIESTSATGLEAVVYSNRIARDRLAAPIPEFNGNRPVEPVMTSALVPSRYRATALSLFPIVGPMSILLVLVGAVVLSGARWFFVTNVVSGLAVPSLLGYLLVDNYRYLLPALVYSLSIATLSAMLLGRTGRAKTATTRKSRERMST